MLSRVVADNDHSYTGNHEGLLYFSLPKRLPSVGRLNTLYAHRLNMLIVETPNASIAPGPMPSDRETSLNVNDFHVAHAHANGRALREVPKRIGVILV